MTRLLKRLIRASSFIVKEIAEVRRQPRLILALILGPFLILLLFGIGYVGETNRLSAIVLVPPTGQYTTDVDQYRKMTGDQVNIVQVTSDRNLALDRLRRHDVDVVVQVPADAAKQIANGSQAIMTVFFNEVDPLRRDYITYSVYLYTNEINKQTLAAAASQGQQSAGDIHTALARMRTSLANVETKLDQGDQAGASQQVGSMQSSSLGVQVGVLLLGQFLSSNSTMVKAPPPNDPDRVDIERSQTVTTRLNGDLEALDADLRSSNPDRAKVKTDISRVRGDLDELDALTRRFQTINPLVLASPFYARAENTAPVKVSFTSFYSPGVIILLLQHIGITLAALSMVRERLLGTLELFRVSPVSPGEIMAGKYISFMLFLGAVAAVLLLLTSNDITVGGVRLSLGVPILGDWALLVVTLAFVIFASIGLGFFIAAISKSESQAVQIAMLVLLASVFFSGFFLRIQVFWEPVRALAYALPVTYGIQATQVLMLRGGVPSPILLIALLLLGAFFGLLSYILFAREYKRG
jgi:ABC-2 type transport system permease protein